ncbi:MAG: acid phosphatase pho5 [Trizodia sp. TS-e1964]|nr:MAG: acid phosphatase pho5 [Trizodia sp. TS-e1964]
MARLATVLSGLACLALVIFFLSTISSFRSSNISFKQPVAVPAESQQDPAESIYPSSPNCASWKSWWHPQRVEEDAQDTPSKTWNLLYHLGGNGPWIEKTDGVLPGGIGPPDGCVVDQVHMLSRHAERYPTQTAGARMLALLSRLKTSNSTLQAPLSFLPNWQFFASEADFEQLISTGPYAGTLESFSTGVKLRTRYQHLLSPNKTNFWASSSPRVVATARIFAAGFFGPVWRENATLHIIPETSDRGADTLTPGDSCKKFKTDTEKGHEYGAHMLAMFRETYLKTTAERLAKYNPGLKLSVEELYTMQEMCGFETLVRGKSPWCNVFTHSEWDAFEYARDVIHYYRSGPGNPYGPSIGLPLLKATTSLLQRGPSAGSLFLSFAHDGDIAPYLAALSIFRDSPLPTTKIAASRQWRMSQVLPMGGRLIFERLSCKAGAFVRVNINDGIVPLPGCNGGPGGSCPLEEWVKAVEKRELGIKKFGDACGVDGKGEVEFLHQ